MSVYEIFMIRFNSNILDKIPKKVIFGVPQITMVVGDAVSTGDHFVLRECERETEREIRDSRKIEF